MIERRSASQPQRRAMAVISIMILLSACEARQPKTPDAKLAEIKATLPGILDSCLTRVKYGGLQAMPDEVDECYAMTPPQLWKGVWLREFEGMRFCPAPAKGCRNEPGPSIWLDLPEVEGKSWPPRRYEIEFIGRRTQHPGMFGHMGLSDHEMIVDKLISLKLLSDDT